MGQPGPLLLRSPLRYPTTGLSGTNLDPSVLVILGLLFATRPLHPELYSGEDLRHAASILGR